ncbi:hypothetical protein WMY93_029813 [Mugilogobius chulae]|uniref:Uncharacterized protein n=1 Tax=Mugilogobius chulae TaxID=88201 RepID=A0AAW0MWW7_9GOBI
MSPRPYGLSHAPLKVATAIRPKPRPLESRHAPLKVATPLESHHAPLTVATPLRPKPRPYDLRHAPFESRHAPSTVATPTGRAQSDGAVPHNSLEGPSLKGLCHTALWKGPL